MTKIIGITGGIGSGKSTLSEHLKKLRFPVHESDKVVSKMYKMSHQISNRGGFFHDIPIWIID